MSATGLLLLVLHRTYCLLWELRMDRLLAEQIVRCAILAVELAPFASARVESIVITLALIAVPELIKWPCRQVPACHLPALVVGQHAAPVSLHVATHIRRVVLVDAAVVVRWPIEQVL